MSATKVFVGVLLGLCFCAGSAHAQGSTYERIAPPKVASNGEASPQPEYPTMGSGLSDWITYRRNNCCEGPVGGSPPIGTEFFLRGGASFPIGGGALVDALNTGWMIQVGGRALFFNQPLTEAWTVDVSISNNHNDCNSNAQVFLPRTQQTVTLRSLDRTFVNLGGGHQWYLWAPATAKSNLRIGVDAGGRYGSGNLRTFELKHDTDVIGGIYAGVQGDLEFPCGCCCANGCCIFMAGFRLEYAYTWTDILQRQADVQDINCLLNLGVRY